MEQDRQRTSGPTSRPALGPSTTPRPAGAGRPWPLGATLAVSLYLAPPAILAQVEVYRCTGPDGAIEFRQHACAPEDATTRVEIEDRRTGWTPPSVEPLTGQDQPDGHRGKRTGADPDKYQDRCWTKRQQLERVNNELRAGYTPGRGERLKRRRREYEAFLSRYCR